MSHFMPHPNPFLCTLFLNKICLNQTLLYSNETLLYNNETLLYSNETLLYNNETLLYSNETLLCSNETLLYNNETLLYSNVSKTAVQLISLHTLIYFHLFSNMVCIFLYVTNKWGLFS